MLVVCDCVLRVVGCVLFVVCWCRLLGAYVAFACGFMVIVCAMLFVVV